MGLNGTCNGVTFYGITAPTPYAVTIAEGDGHGAVTADVTRARAGATVTLTVAPNPGWTLDRLTYAEAGGEPVDMNGGNSPCRRAT